MHSNDTVIAALGICVATRTPVLLWGPPGSGKTSTVTALAQGLGLPLEVVVASISDPTDFGGLPVVVDGGVRLAPPAWARRLAASDGILFLDEITTAPPAVQAALLRVVLERHVGDLALGPGVAVIAAANPPEEAADGWDLAAPLANRFCHLPWRLDAATFVAGLAGGWPCPAVPEVPAGLGPELAAARGLVAGFLTARTNLVQAVPRGSQAGGAWPSPRSWERAAHLWAAATAAGVGDDARALLVSGCVGEGAALEFLAFTSALDLQPPEDLLRDPALFQVPERPDQLFAVLSSVTAAVAADPTPKRWEAAWAVLSRVTDTMPDVAALAARSLAGCRPAKAKVPAGVRRLEPVLRQADLLGA